MSFFHENFKATTVLRVQYDGYQLIRTIIRNPIHEWYSDRNGTRNGLPHSSSPISTTRGDHELQGWSRLRDFFRTYLTGLREGIPCARTWARSGYWRIHSYLSRNSLIYVFIFCPKSFVSSSRLQSYLHKLYLTKNTLSLIMLLFY